LQLSLPISPQVLTLSQSRDANCDAFQRGTYSQKSQGQAATYTADQFAILCSFFELYPASNQGEYLIQIKGENQIGRSTRLFVYNQETDRSDIEEILPRKDFTQFYSLLS